MTLVVIESRVRHDSEVPFGVSARELGSRQTSETQREREDLHTHTRQCVREGEATEKETK